MIKANAKDNIVEHNSLLKNYDQVLRNHQLIAFLSDKLERYKKVIEDKRNNEHVIHRYLRDNREMWLPTKKRSVYEYQLKENGKKKYVIGISSITPEGLIIIGRGINLTENQKQKLRLHNERESIRIMTYDDVAEECRNHILHLANLS